MIRIAICDDNEIICEELAGLAEAFMKKQNREYRIDKFKAAGWNASILLFLMKGSSQ